MTENNKKLFEFQESINAQLERMEHIRQSDPEKALKLIKNGEAVIQYAQNGQLRKIGIFVNVTEKGDILYYHIIQAFKECLLRGHLVMADFFIENGYPFSGSFIPPVLVSCLNEAEDYQGVSITNYLASKGYDINLQAPQTWITALHVAVQRQLVNTIRELLEHGADVNAVAKDDIMPLSIAETLDESSCRETIIRMLTEKGARNTWRTKQLNTASSGVTSTMVSFKGGGGPLNIPNVNSREIVTNNSEADLVNHVVGLTLGDQIHEFTGELEFSVSDDGGMMFSAS